VLFENEDSKASKPWAPLPNPNPVDGDGLDAEGTGANGSPPKGSEDFCEDSLNFLLEKGSKDSSRFSPGDEIGAKGSDPGVENALDGFGHAKDEAKGSLLDEDELNGSLKARPAGVTASEVRPNAAVTGAVKGSSFSRKGSLPASSKGSPYR